MHVTFATIASLAALLTTATASDPKGALKTPGSKVAVAPHANGKGIRRAVHERVGGKRKKSAPAELASVYKKYGKEPPAQVAHAAAIAAQGTETGSVIATNYPGGYDLFYGAPVQVGNQTFTLNLDTGSSDLWVFSNLLPASQQGSHVLYNPTSSPLSGETWDITYGDGSGASGVVYADQVNVGGATATVQAVEAATSVSSAFVGDIADGLLGLGLESGNTCRPYLCNTFMTQVGPSLEQDLFTATLKRGAPGTYDFGYIDSSKYTGNIAYTPVTSTLGGQYWEVTASGYSIGSGKKVASSIVAIPDTGTSLALVDNAIVKAFYKPVKNAHYNSTWGAYIFPCKNIKQVPTLSIFFGGAKRTMAGIDALYARVTSPKGYCYGGVQSNTGLGFSLLGDIFLKSQFVVYDLTNNRVGFAQQKN